MVDNKRDTILRTVAPCEWEKYEKARKVLFLFSAICLSLIFAGSLGTLETPLGVGTASINSLVF